MAPTEPMPCFNYGINTALPSPAFICLALPLEQNLVRGGSDIPAKEANCVH